MNNDLKKAIYIILGILIIILYTSDSSYYKDHFYKNIKEIPNPNDILVLVNKNNKLPKTFVPNHLRPIDINYAFENKYLTDIAASAFEKLSADAKKIGYKIIAVSTYRDYQYQANLYNNYIELKGINYADLASARPGHSEHQTGLAVDVMGENNDYNAFLTSKAFPWMKTNAHKYGFILRYPKGKEHITGFKYEPWHYRYVGIDVAKTIYENNLTLEEYLNQV